VKLFKKPAIGVCYAQRHPAVSSHPSPIKSGEVRNSHQRAKKKSGGGACLQYSPKTPAGVADVCICCVKKMKNVRMEMVCWMSSTHASPHYAAFGNKNL
jgi:hypothetical protein